MVTKSIPDDLIKDLQYACGLHQRAVSNYEECVRFNRIMSELLYKLEDAGHSKTAGKVMTILLHCNPKDGAHCEQAIQVGEKMKKL